jgi:hypothetical protein
MKYIGLEEILDAFRKSDSDPGRESQKDEEEVV